MSRWHPSHPDPLAAPWLADEPGASCAPSRRSLAGAADGSAAPALSGVPEFSLWVARHGREAGRTGADRNGGNHDRVGASRNRTAVRPDVNGLADERAEPDARGDPGRVLASIAAPLPMRAALRLSLAMSDNDNAPDEGPCPTDSGTVWG